MNRTSVVLGTLVILNFTLLSARAQETKTAKIEELLKVTNAETMSQQVYGQMRAMATRQMEAVGGSEGARAAAVQSMDKLMAQLQERLSWAKMKPGYVQLYDEVYSDEEITGILAFYKSAAGQAFVNKMPLLMTKSMELAQRQMADLLPEIQRITKEAGEKSKGEEPKK